MKVHRVELRDPVTINTPRILIEGKEGVTDLTYSEEDEVVVFRVKNQLWITSLHGNVKSICVNEKPLDAAPSLPSRAGPAPLASFPDDAEVDADSKVDE